MCGREDAGETGCCCCCCCSDAAPGGAHDACFARGMITGRSGEAGSTEDLGAAVMDHKGGEDGPADGGEGGAAPAGSGGGRTVETGGSAGTGGGGMLLTLDAACPWVLELADGGVWERAEGAGGDHCVWTLRTGAGGATGAEIGVIVAGILRGDVGAGVGVTVSNSVWATLSSSGGGRASVSCASSGAPWGSGGPSDG